MDINNTKRRYKRAWNEKAERKVKKRIKLKEQQDYICTKIHKLLEPKCRLNCNTSSNSSNNNLSVSIESEEENLQPNELIDLHIYSQDKVDLNDTSSENRDESENRNENENICDNESIDESENRNENANTYGNESTDESENMDENEHINESESSDESENENVNMIFENDEQKENYVLSALHKWALSGGVISMSKIDELLAKLQPVFNNLPKSYKTLLKTDDIHVTQFEHGGQFWYRGIQNYLNGLSLERYLQVKKKIEIDINADGLPLYRSGKKKFWPILGHLVDTKNQPFIIAIYFGKSDPNNVQEFLQDFIDEVENLITNGYIRNESTYDFAIRHYILDAPARELIKCCIGHNGYASCEKCTVWGERLDHRQTYIDLQASLRTDESFQQQMQPHHHKGISPLLQINTKMVSQFRLEPMHLVYEGVFKRLLEVWKNWITPWKLHWTVVNRISDKLLLLAPSCPQDFVRKPRTLNELPFYKATEFRRLCLYDGIVAFASHIDVNIYKHFLLLHCGIYILASPILYKALNAYANTVLRVFIEHSVTLFGKSFVVYNVHSLCHLAQECDAHGCLDTFSAFRYENKLKTIKSNLKSGFQPIQQAAKREIERSKKKVIIDSEVNKIVLSQEHRDINENIHGEQFRKISINGVVFKVNKRDSCFKTNTGQVVILKNIVRTEDNIILVGNIFSNISEFYTYPLRSSELGIVKVSELIEEKMLFTLNNIIAKCWLIPIRNEYVCIPLLHTILFYK